MPWSWVLLDWSVGNTCSRVLDTHFQCFLHRRGRTSFKNKCAIFLCSQILINTDVSFWLRCWTNCHESVLREISISRKYSQQHVPNNIAVWFYGKSSFMLRKASSPLLWCWRKTERNEQTKFFKNNFEIFFADLIQQHFQAGKKRVRSPFGLIWSSSVQTGCYKRLWLKKFTWKCVFVSIYCVLVIIYLVACFAKLTYRLFKGINVWKRLMHSNT